MSAFPPTVDEQLSLRLRKRFPSNGATAFTLEVSFAVPAGFTILFGASGAGKTSVLDCIAGLQTPDEGDIAIGEIVLFDAQSGRNVPTNRRSVGYLLQSLALFPHMTVEQNVEYGLAALQSSEREARCREVLESFRIAALAPRRPGEISGGERQRAALARALVTRPHVLLLDEPLTALDAVTKARIVDDLRAWVNRHRIPILYVTHDREEVFTFANNVIVLEGGRVVAQGPPHDVLNRPQSETVAQLAGFENIFECSIHGSHPEQGTMTCRISGSALQIEVPLTRVDPSRPLQVGIRAGDILLASVAPQGLSARNVLYGSIASMEQLDMTVKAKVDCGAEFEVHLTPGARQSLRLEAGAKVWLVVKTYSCHVLQQSSSCPIRPDSQTI